MTDAGQRAQFFFVQQSIASVGTCSTVIQLFGHSGKCSAVREATKGGRHVGTGISVSRGRDAGGYFMDAADNCCRWGVSVYHDRVLAVLAGPWQCLETV